jgi:2-phosphoglycerate kinase
MEDPDFLQYAVPNTNPHIQSLFSQAYILGGSPCSGKSTIAENLASDYKLTYYKVDDHQQSHLGQVRADRHPVMHRYLQMNWEQIWMRPPELQVQEELAFYQENFEMILEDLSHHHLDRPVLLEGAGLLPQLVYQFGVQPEHAVFMVPTWEFQLTHYSRRSWIQEILAECSQPQLAFENWMRRDQLFGREVLHQATVHGYPTVVVDGSQGIESRLYQVRSYFRLTSKPQ